MTAALEALYRIEHCLPPIARADFEAIRDALEERGAPEAPDPWTGERWRTEEP